MGSSNKPTHLIGRGEFNGPVGGIYHVYTAHIDNVLAAAADQRIWAIKLPWDFYILQFTARAASDDVTTATVDLRHTQNNFAVGDTPLLSAPLNLLSAFVRGETAGNNAGDEATLINSPLIQAGRILFAEFLTTGGTNGVEDVSLTVSGYILGHINDDLRDDVARLT